MKNKGLMTLLVIGLFVPAFAAEETAAPAKAGNRPVMAQQKGEFLKAQKEHRAQMKATEEKMEKLVKEYKKLKGKKQETKKAEIVAEVEKIHEEQLKFKQAQLDKFAARLEEMKKHLDEEKSDEGKKVWVEEKTAALIEADGDVKVLFAPKGAQFGPQGPKGKKGFFKGHKGPKGPRMDDGDPGRVGLLPPPPPPPVEEK